MFESSQATVPGMAKRVRSAAPSSSGTSSKSTLRSSSKHLVLVGDIRKLHDTCCLIVGLTLAALMASSRSESKSFSQAKRVSRRPTQSLSTTSAKAPHVMATRSAVVLLLYLYLFQRNKIRKTRCTLVCNHGTIMKQQMDKYVCRHEETHHQQ